MLCVCVCGSGYYDEVPDFVQSPDGLGLRIKFGPFSQTVAHAAVWLKDQRVSTRAPRSNRVHLSETRALQRACCTANKNRKKKDYVANVHHMLISLMCVD